jgi:hypothetical protein
MIAKRLALALGLILIVFSIFAQVEEPVRPVQDNSKKTKEKLTFGERLVFGGDLSLSVGTYTYINVSPAIGYRVTDRFIVGLGPMYIYENYKNYHLESSTYGAKFISSFVVLRGSDIGPNFAFGNLIAHAENEVINVQPLMYDPSLQINYFGQRQWIDDLLIGGGLSQSLGSKFSVSVLILWDVTQNMYSPYSNPIFKVGFGF